jgi:cytochrome c peroxidase
MFAIAPPAQPFRAIISQARRPAATPSQRSARVPSSAPRNQRFAGDARGVRYCGASNKNNTLNAIEKMRSVGLGALFLLCASCSGGGGGDGGTSQASSPTGVNPANPPSGVPGTGSGTGGVQPLNRAPIVANPIQQMNITVGRPFRYDATQAGTTFSDPDGDPLTYEMELRGAHDGFTLDGTTITGIPPGLMEVSADITARDPHGLAISDFVRILVVKNFPPAADLKDQFTTTGTLVDYDISRAFSDPEGDRIHYAITLPFATHGLAVNGTRVTGLFDSVASVFVAVTATDDYGAASEMAFSIAATVPASGTPTLPAQRYAYADAELPLPGIYTGHAAWDTTRLTDNKTTDAGATLGRVLFYDKRLSITNTLACASCHHQERGFTIPARFAVGVAGLPTRRNPMALGNVRFNVGNRFFADERVRELEQMVLMPIQDPIELDNSLETVVARLEATSFYPQLFADTFDTPEITSDRIAKALAQFLRSMINYQAKFDVAMHPMVYSPARQDPSGVFDAREIRGLELFEMHRCSQCHEPDTHNQERPSNNGIDLVPSDLGSGNGMFRAASLRNVVLTAPYMHDGRFQTLREVIDQYDHGVQDSSLLDVFMREFPTPEHPVRRLSLSEADKQALEAFLNTLTDDSFLHDPKFSNPFN